MFIGMEQLLLKLQFLCKIRFFTFVIGPCLVPGICYCLAKSLSDLEEDLRGYESDDCCSNPMIAALSDF